MKSKVIAVASTVALKLPDPVGERVVSRSRRRVPEEV
jgi:hypothetical protein